ncbi:hypothetical protein TrLO_g13062 [Triparma laevis f. longispina]|uniref:non-specific serine/threonine protein kinase n=1 Tax=Triparma laevis f. longispina TaxID=1714387 RepID=A0A9W7FLG9_9STRA|nr:hypothetical protein TrLO_g13062 [Triparma laevis f. longispina]
MASWGPNPTGGRSLADIIRDEECSRQSSSGTSSDPTPSQPLSEEDYELQLALAISASMASSPPNPPTPMASTPAPPAPPPAQPQPQALDDKLDESLALALQLQNQEEEQLAAFKQNTRTINAGNSKVKIQFTHPTHNPHASSNSPPAERFGADDVERYEILYGLKDTQEQTHEDALVSDVSAPGFQMNSNRPASSTLNRLPGTDFVQDSETKELRTKHDPSLNHQRNALNMQSISGNVSDKVYNSYRAKIKTTHKGVAKHGTGQAETAFGNKTADGALDASVLQVIRKAIDVGIIDACHGCVKEGKEAQIFYAYRNPSTPPPPPPAPTYNPPHIAVKVMKRIQDFRNRGSYVDGDVRFHRKKFSDYDKRDQVALWAEKEFRNLFRSFLAGVSVPRPIMFKQNLLMMNFLGDDGFPAPNLKDIESMDAFSSAKRVVHYYCETIVGVKRLYVCAQLIHGDLSEYNIMLVPSDQIRLQVSSDSDQDLDDPAKRLPVKKNRIVLIDFAQAVQKSHPEGEKLLLRDVNRVNKFFSKYITVISDEDVVNFITGETDPEGVDEWVDLGSGEESDTELIEKEEVVEENAQVEEITEEEEDEDATTFVSVSESGLLSDTTSVKKDKWRYRKHDLNDFKAFETLHEQVAAIQPAKKNQEFD